jgi:hypothetical protein
MNFKDYFSKQASEYTRYRPHYPEALFEYLATLVSSRQGAWGRPGAEKEIHWPINMRIGKAKEA